MEALPQWNTRQFNFDNNIEPGTTNATLPCADSYKR